MMTFPMKKRINTELFIDRKQWFIYIKTGMVKPSGKIEDGQMYCRKNENVGMRTENGSLFGMTLTLLKVKNIVV